jgi:hypothetical protein
MKYGRRTRDSKCGETGWMIVGDTLLPVLLEIPLLMQDLQDNNTHIGRLQKPQP